MRSSFIPSEVWSDGLFYEVFQKLPFAAFVIDRSGDVLALNESMVSVLENEGDKYAQIKDLLRENDEYCLRKVLSASSGETLTFVLGSQSNEVSLRIFVLEKSAGQAKTFLLLQTESGTTGRTNQVQTAEEFSAKKHMELEALYEDLSELQSFCSHAAHDLKAPLASIKTWIDIYLESYGQRLCNDEQKILKILNRSAKRLDSFVGRLHQHAQTKSSEINLETVNINSLLGAVIEDLSGVIVEADVDVKIEVNKNLNLVADHTLLEQLFRNLISNAIKYRSPDRKPTVTVGLKENVSGEKIFFVKDNGLGFEASKLNYILKPFNRLNASESIEGTGLGLSICQDICVKHGWFLDATSVKNEGSVFKVII